MLPAHAGGQPWDPVDAGHATRRQAVLSQLLERFCPGVPRAEQFSAIIVGRDSMFIEYHKVVEIPESVKDEMFDHPTGLS
jgi:hypothetical protein